ncbi:response regulator transcription factor [Demequina capsici]|uniref:Response regulator transcription factor n=1 Tax=Demequina capsici TaxID=3075620 RepID=A0AA96F9U5_9MICO|nr:MULTISPECIES: response regulator transcription factor [unclassified Demequina]WNM24731.1 response regulator transcription factor [Demequina sp. OYTSA14]WNM27640.1 response regulator transcription factor [Demequina sp. PMTSA13]
MNESRPRLLLAEDDPQLGPIMTQVLDEVYEVQLAVDGVEALDAARLGRFDVLVIDRRLPSLDGVAMIERLRAGGVTTPALMLTALGTVQDKVTGLDAGANDYLVKPFEFDELFARLRAIRRSGTVEEEPTLRIGSWEFAPESRTITSPTAGRKVLTARETALLHLLAAHPERTFSREEILDGVFESTDTLGTVDTYVHYLRKKTAADVVTTVRGRGYRVGQP